MKNFNALFLMIFFAASVLIINACNDEEKDPDAGEDASVDASDDSGTAEGFLCLECHIDKDLLLADLEADPLPEPEEPPESEGEG